MDNGGESCNRDGCCTHMIWKVCLALAVVLAGAELWLYLAVGIYNFAGILLFLAALFIGAGFWYSGRRCR